MATNRSVAAKRPAARSKAPSSKAFGPENSPLANVPLRYHTWIFIGLLLLSLLVFFGGVIFSGKLFAAGDFISWESFRPYIDMMDKKGEAPLWIPYIFSGMPAFASYLVTGDRWWDLALKIFYSSEHIFGFVDYPVMRVVMHYFIYGIGMYLLMRARKAARSTSFFVAFAAIFSTWIIIYIIIGHNTKIMTLMSFPYIFLCLEQLKKRWSLLYAGLLVLAVHILWEAAQANTAFYGACAIGIYLAVELIGGLVAKEKISGVIRAGLAMAVAAGFTYGMGMDRNLAVQEYLPYSTRSAPPLKASATKGDDQSETATNYDYSTNWSFSPAEMFTYVVPAYFGFGKLKYSSGAEEPHIIEGYWGQMPFTDAGHYMGIAVLILGLFGFWRNRRNRFVQAMALIGLFGLVLSFGKNLSLLFDLFYYHVPSFNKLRAPSQSLVLLEFVFPILAGFGIESLASMHRTKEINGTDRRILYGAALMGAFLLFGLLGTSLMKGDYMETLATARNTARLTPDQQSMIYSTMTGDWIFSGLFGTATLLAMYYYLKGRITPTAFSLLLFGILIIDLWRVDYRPMDTVPGDTIEKTFALTDVDRFLAQDSSQYRILDISRGPNYPAYRFQQHILGYSSAKMRNYQDLLEIAGNGNVPTSPLAWDLLNTKYIIAEGPIAEGMQPIFQSKEKKAMVFENKTVMPRAWFVNRLEVADGLTILNKIKNNEFNPADVAFIPDSSKSIMAGIQPAGSAPAADSSAPHHVGDTLANPASGATLVTTPQAKPSGSVHFTRYEPLHIAMDVEAPGKNFLVISEINYPPCWHATLDGQPAQVIQTDYLLRGMVIPPGKHKIEMNYVSRGFETGKWTSLGLNIAMFLAIAVGVVIDRKRKPEPEETDPEHAAPGDAADDVV